MPQKYPDIKKYFQQFGLIVENRSPLSFPDEYLKEDSFLSIGTYFRPSCLVQKDCVDVDARDFFKKEYDFSPDYHKIRPSPIAMWASIGKYSKCQPSFNVSSMRESFDWLELHFGPYLKGSRLSTREECLQAMDLTTSCGAFWNLIYTCKKDFFESYISHLVEKYIEIEHSELRCVPECWAESQKREIRSDDKLNFYGLGLDKVRTFLGSSAPIALEGNKLFLDFNTKFYGSALKTWSFVGATTFRRGFHRIYEKFKKYNNVWEFDISEYDSSIFIALIEGVTNFIWNCYNPGLKTKSLYNRVYMMMHTIIFSLVFLENGHVILKLTGNPSGNVSTIVFNTLILFVLFAYVWIESHRKKKIATSYNDYMRNSEQILNGDDNDLAVSDEKIQLYNPKIIMEEMALLNIKLTTPTTVPRFIQDCSFLSHDFVKVNHLFLPSPSYNRVISSLIEGSRVSDTRWSYLRACALFITSWANRKCRDHLNTYLNYLQQNKSYKLNGSINGIPMSDIFNMRFNDRQCWSLYSGDELCSYWCNLLICIKTPSMMNPTKLKQTLKKIKNKEKSIVKNAVKKIKKKTKKYRKKPSLVGQGGYFSDLGNSFGANFGSKIGSFGGGLLDKIFGNGDYSVKSNSLMKMDMGQPVASFNKGTYGEVRVTHEEMLAQVTEPANNAGMFNIVNFFINPGLVTSMPWASTLASSFQQYRLNGMILFYKTESTPMNTAQLGIGSVNIATNYNSSEANYTSVQQMLASQYATSEAPWKNFLHPIECAPEQTTVPNKYIRNGPVPSGDDQRLYDWANVQIATSGVPNNTNVQVLGQLWVSYDVTFLKPILSNQNIIGSSNFWLWNASNPTSSEPFNNNSLLMGNTTAPELTNNTLSITGFQGTFLLVYQQYVAAGWTPTGGVSLWSTTGGITAIKLFPGSATNFDNAEFGSTVTSYAGTIRSTQTFAFTCTGTGTITPDTVFVTSSATNTNIFLILMSNTSIPQPPLFSKIRNCKYSNCIENPHEFRARREKGRIALSSLVNAEVAEIESGFIRERKINTIDLVPEFKEDKFNDNKYHIMVGDKAIITEDPSLFCLMDGFRITKKPPVVEQSFNDLV